MASRPPTKRMLLFQRVAYWEGISYILLLFVAMPLKYFADMPIAVKVVGMAHGGLFILYLVALLLAHIEAKWDYVRSITFLGASIIPFATFWVEKSVKEEIELRKQQYAD